MAWRRDRDPSKARLAAAVKYRKVGVKKKGA